MYAEKDPLVTVCRHPKDWQRGSVRLSKMDVSGYDCVSGGVQVPFPRPMMVAYIECTDVEDGEVAHSCSHGPAPHRIKVAITKKHNEHLYQRLEWRIRAKQLRRMAPKSRLRVRTNPPPVIAL